MCGVAGYVQRADSAPANLEGMLARLAHRGPDGCGTWRSASSPDGWSVALGHRRLSIIDLYGGAQPLGNEDGHMQITFNGEIYNYRELRQDLIQLGHRFRTSSDTEAIVHHFEQRGTDGLSDLNGMFAFAIWDADARTLTLARDRAGIKPLYYASLPDGGLVFASELTALMEHRAVKRELSPGGIAELFFRDYAPAPQTVLKGVRKLEPGHFVVWSAAEGLRTARPFWTLKASAHQSEPGDLASRLKESLEQAVSSQMVSDVPVGVFLSGGIDSSLVAAIAQRHARGRLSTFSIGFRDRDYDESEFARQAARHIGSDHFEQILSEEDLVAVLDAALSVLDEPIGDPSILPTYMLSALAAKKVKVVLGGDGGDELWAGYPTYRAHRLARVYSAMPRFARSTFLEPLIRRLPVGHGYQSLEWKLKRFALRFHDDPATRHEQWMSAATRDEVEEAIPGWAPPVQSKHSPVERPRDLVNQALALDFLGYLPGSVLTKVDRASMAHGLEVRPPLLENRLIDFAFSLPSDAKLRGSAGKLPLKRVAEDYLPREIVHRRKKGFAIPLARWIATTLKPRLDKILRDSPVWNVSPLKRQVFQSWLHDHFIRKSDHARPLWSLIVLDQWMRRTECRA